MCHTISRGRFLCKTGLDSCLYLSDAPHYSFATSQRRKSYHFYRPNVDWKKQFDNMTSVVKTENQDLVPIIDIEHRGSVSAEDFIADLRSFIEKVTAYYGKKPLLYTYHNFYNRYLQGEFTDYHFMIARYRSDSPTLNDGKDYIMWQYTQTGSIPGIRGHVDRSKIMGNFSLNQVMM